MMAGNDGGREECEEEKEKDRKVEGEHTLA